MRFAAIITLLLVVVSMLLVLSCDRDSVTPSGSQPPPSASPGEATAPEKSAESTAATPLLDKSFDDIKFDIEPGDPFFREMLTPEIEALDGERILIRGWILPTAQKRGLKEFVLVRDNLECCFGPGAALYDCILIEMQPGKTAEFSVYPVAVTGKFAIRELTLPDGTHLAIYRMVAEGVE